MSRFAGVKNFDLVGEATGFITNRLEPDAYGVGSEFGVQGRLRGSSIVGYLIGGNM